MKKTAVEWTSVADIDQSPLHLLRRALQTYTKTWQQKIPMLSPPQFASLLAINELPKLSQSKLSKITAIDSSTMAEMLSRMEKRSLLVRTEDPDNSRRYLLRLTNEGREQIEQAKCIERQVREEALSELTADEIETLVMLLRKIAG
ncbi:MarR family winged helix-turn-helix transcriptional regulator [Celerinatantimonas sp. YJH-8]|uniref:MarR family winged helix-turn-helix transcriptional regulator n=1 Tax=Celerinatantimonas sp. YJH-8 TaxID=3228714 RepID=UPI0038C68C81